MRPTLTQAILAALCAILCNLSALGGGGMMLGARTACWSGGTEPHEYFLRNTGSGYVDLGICNGWSGVFTAWADLRINDAPTDGECYVFNSWGGTQFGIRFLAGSKIATGAARTDITEAIPPSKDCSSRAQIKISHWGAGSLSPGLYAFNRGGFMSSEYFIGDIWRIKVWDTDGVLRGDFTPKEQGGIVGFFNSVDNSFHAGTNQADLLISYDA